MLALNVQAPPLVQAPPSTWPAAAYVQVKPLTDEHRAETLEFLAARPVHTVYMAGLIRDNGLVNPLNRGSFYSCRDAKGKLTGVALIGHITAIETTEEAAIESFARLAARVFCCPKNESCKIDNLVDTLLSRRYNCRFVVGCRL